MQRWVNARNVTANGVVQFELTLSSLAPLGMWRINLTFGVSDETNEKVVHALHATQTQTHAIIPRTH